MNHFSGTHDKGPFQYLAKFTVPTANTCYEYKYIIDGQWLADETKATKNGNNFFEISANAD